MFDYNVHMEADMKAGETVVVRVNIGQWCEVQVVEIHGDSVRFAGPSELRIVRERGRDHLGVGFRVHTFRTTEKAKQSLHKGIYQAYCVKYESPD